jgi:hypothetical protein
MRLSHPTPFARCSAGTALAALALWLAVPAAPAQVFPFTTIQRVSVAPQPVVNPEIDYLVTLGQSKDGSRALVARTFDKRTGFQAGSALVIPL